MDDNKSISDFIANLYRIGHMLQRAEHNPRYYGSDIQLYPNEAYTLRAIAESPGISQKELTTLMRRTKGATSVVVQKLVQKGLVESRNESLDQRIINLYPTERGADVVGKHQDYDRRYIALFLHNTGLSASSMEQLNQTLIAFTDFVDQRSHQKHDDFT